jgi:hypothetical protein
LFCCPGAWLARSAAFFRPITTLRLLPVVQKDHLSYATRRRVLHPAAEPTQRRYEALRSYFVDGLSAAAVGERFGYSPQVVHQMASELRAGQAEFFHSSTPGPKGPRKAARIRDRVLALRARDRSVTEIAQALAGEGTPVSAQTVWSILDAEGLERLERRAPAERGAPPPRLSPVKARAIPFWPAGLTLPCDHAGLFLLVPGIVELGLPELIAASHYPSTEVLSAWQSLGSLLLAKCARKARVSHTDALADDDALGLLLGLTALPKATHLTSYSYRVRRSSNEQLLTGVTKRLRELGLASGEEGFNLDFHAIRHHGQDTPLEKHYVPRRSQRTRAVLTFFAQDHASTEMVYANADLTKAEQAREIIAFADYWRQVSGEDPGLLVFDSKLTTYKVLSELTARGIRWMTLRERGPKLLADLAARPHSHWSTVRIERTGRYRTPEIIDELITIKDLEGPVRQLAVRNIGREHPHPADHQRHPAHHQTTLRPLRRTDEHRERTRRLHLRLPPRPALLRPTPQRRPGHHPHRHRRQPLPAPRPPTPPLRARHPRPHLAPLPRQHRHPPHRQADTPARAPHPHLPPRPHRRRPRRPSHPHPLARRPPAQVPVPTPLKPQPDFLTENGGRTVNCVGGLWIV